MNNHNAEQQPANTLVERTDRSFNESGFINPLLIVGAISKLRNRPGNEGRNSLVRSGSKLIAGGVAAGVLLSAIDGWQDRDHIEATPDMEGGVIEAEFRTEELLKTADLRTALISMSVVVDAGITGHMKGPGPDSAYPDPDTSYKFTASGESEIHYPMSKLEIEETESTVSLMVNPADILVNAYWKDRAVDQADDNERRIYGTLDTLDAANPFIDLDIDSMIHKMDDNAVSALDGKALEVYLEECAPKLEGLVRESTDEGLTKAVQSLGISKTIVIEWKPGEINFVPEEDETEPDKGSIDINTFEFDKTSCDSTEMKVAKAY